MVGGLASIGGTVIGVFIISLLQQGIMAFGLGKGQQMINHRTYRNCSSLMSTFLQDAERTDRKGGCNNG